MDPTTPAALDPPATVLLVHPKRTTPDACEELCYDGEAAHLAVTFADEPPNCPDAEAVDGPFGQLTVGDVLTDGDESEPDFSQPIVTDSVTDPTDLAAIGVAVSRFCKRWDDADEEISVCFDSLDALLRHTSPTEVFQFTHVLANRFESVDAYAHFHFDPTHYEDRVVSTFGTIFDAVIAEDTDESLPEATDEDVAALLAEWDEASDAETDLDTITEATDEDIERILGN